MIRGAIITGKVAEYSRYAKLTDLHPLLLTHHLHRDFKQLFSKLLYNQLFLKLLFKTALLRATNNTKDVAMSYMIDRYIQMNCSSW